MNQTTNLALKPGSTVSMPGFFTKRHTLGDLRNGKELERRLGFEPGSLALGWYVLYLVGRTPRPDEFLFGGYTHFSGGHIEGHKSINGAHVEASLQADAVNIAKAKAAAAEGFTIIGPQRLTKIYPVLKPRSYWHPDPNPVPQWQLTVALDFEVHEFVPGR